MFFPEHGHSVTIRNLGPTYKITQCYDQQEDKANHQYHRFVCFVSETTDHNLMRFFILKLRVCHGCDCEVYYRTSCCLVEIYGSSSKTSKVVSWAPSSTDVFRAALQHSAFLVLRHSLPGYQVSLPGYRTVRKATVFLYSDKVEVFFV
jgi:hypothetical protein